MSNAPPFAANSKLDSTTLVGSVNQTSLAVAGSLTLKTSRSRLGALFGLAAFLGVVRAPEAHGQSTSFFLGVGPSWYDFRGAGRGTAYAPGRSWPVLRIVDVHLRATLLRYDGQGVQVGHLFQVGLRLIAPNSAFRPYLGTGLGYAVGLWGGTGGGNILYGEVGLWVRWTERVGAWSELRVRAVNPFSASTGDLLFGLSLADRRSTPRNR